MKTKCIKESLIVLLNQNKVHDIKLLLQGDPSIEHLDLSCIKIGKSGLDLLAEIIKDNNTLTHLYLAHNSITDDMVSELAKSLKYNKTLKFIDLRWNNLTIKSLRALEENIISNSSLNEVYLANNCYLKPEEYPKDPRLSSFMKIYSNFPNIDVSCMYVRSGSKLEKEKELLEIFKHKHGIEKVERLVYLNNIICNTSFHEGLELALSSSTHQVEDAISKIETLMGLTHDNI